MNIVELNNICKSFDKNYVLKNYSLSISEGDFICIMGKSGSGKSTLLNIIGMLEQADEGDITICGIKNPLIENKNGRELARSKISYLFQNYGLVEDLTVEKNLLFATKYLKNKENINELIKNALIKVGLSGFEKKKVYQLSGGEQQRVALARVIIKPCQIILADEPTGSLDPYNRDEILKIIKELNKIGKTVIMVTHDEMVVKHANRIEKL